MTKLILILLLSFNFTTAVAQSDSTALKAFKYGVRAGFYGTSYINSLNYFAYFTVGMGKHEFAFGPSIGKSPTLLSNFKYESHELDYKLNGIDLSYRITPNGGGKIFDFYFQVDIFQKWGKRRAEDYINNWPNIYENNFIPVTTKSKASMLLFEYGFDAKFLKFFYVGPSIGIGGKMEFRKYDYTDNEQFNYKETLFDLDVVLRANLGIRF